MVKVITFSPANTISYKTYFKLVPIENAKPNENCENYL